MATESGIEWTEQTWNPMTGCTKVSPGCKHCYAESMAKRLKAMGAPGYERGFQLSLHPGRLRQPLHRRKSTTYFVNSMSDLFHKDVPDDYLDQVFDVMHATPHHTYQVLTKRAERLPEYFKRRACPSNVWLGVSVENRKHGVPRVDLLRRVNARVRFLSVEPLLEDLGQLDLHGVHWVIVGGESGPKARPMRLEWAESVLQQAREAGVAAFMKQVGTWPIGRDGVRVRTSTRKGGVMADWPQSLRLREMPLQT
jgi:protein gp37